MNEIVFDEINTLKNSLKALMQKKTRQNATALPHSYCVVADGNPIAEYALSALSALKKDGCVDKLYYMSATGEDTEERTRLVSGLSGVSLVDWQDLSGAAPQDTAFLCFFDCRASADRPQVWQHALGACLDAAAAGRRNSCVVSALMPYIDAIPGDADHLAEREYSFILESFTEQKTPEQLFYLGVEKRCRDVVAAGFESVSLLRFQNVFGPNALCMAHFDLAGAVGEIFAGGGVTIETSDYEKMFSCIYIRDAVTAVFTALMRGNPGHVYNAAAYTTTPAEIKSIVHQLFMDRLALNASARPVRGAASHALCNYKLLRIGWKPAVELREALYRTVCSEAGIPYDISHKLSVYNGKLRRIKEIEVELLKEVDRICRENGIQYFLAAGTLLGAVRNNRSIPWDDDLDIGMLREDFEKFRRVCPGALSEKFIYSSPWTDDACHYYIDKIRLNNTYFSTAYSGNFVFRDGVFLDIIVYDKTSNHRWLERLQIKLIKAWVRAISIRWYNRPRKKLYYRLTKLLLPVMRLFPFKMYHKIFDMCAMMFYKSKKSRYLIDSLGQHIHYGRFPKEWLETVTYTKFDGVTAPIPTGYDEYLSFFYGKDYKNSPPLSYRAATHKLSRIDLGEYLLSSDGSAAFRDADIRGELFERDKAGKA